MLGATVIVANPALAARTLTLSTKLPSPTAIEPLQPPVQVHRSSCVVSIYFILFYFILCHYLLFLIVFISSIIVLFCFLLAFFYQRRLSSSY